MKISTLITGAALALLVSTNVGVAAEVKTDAGASATGSVAVGDTQADVTGAATLGMDISTAGSTPEAQTEFFAGLTADEQTNIKAKCEAVIASPSNYSAEVAAFCNATAKVQ